MKPGLALPRCSPESADGAIVIEGLRRQSEGSETVHTGAKRALMQGFKPVDNMSNPPSEPRRKARPRGRPAVLATIPRCFLEYLASCGVSAYDIYPEELVERIQRAGRYEEIPEERFIRMFAPAIEATGRPDLVLAAMFTSGERLIGQISDLVGRSETIKEAVGHLVRYNNLTGCLGNFEMRLDGNRMVVRWPEGSSDVLDTHTMEYRMAIIAIGLRMVCQEPDMLVDVTVPFAAPSYTELYQQTFGGVTTFGAKICELTSPSRSMDGQRIVLQGSRQPLSETETEARIEAGDAEHFHGLLTSFILQNMTSARVSVEDAAQALKVSSRTLQRWLEKTGIHYQELLDQIRMQESKRLLMDPNVSLPRITFMLGYTAQSNFQTAFRRWTGMSPGAFRDSHLGINRKRRTPSKKGG